MDSVLSTHNLALPISIRFFVERGNPHRAELQQWIKVVSHIIVVKDTSRGLGFKAEFIPILLSTYINLILNVFFVNKFRSSQCKEVL